MRMFIASLRLVLLIFSFATCCYASDAEKKVSLIKIQCGWGGLGNRQDVLVQIQHARIGFIRDGERVDEILVQDLVRAFSVPPIAKPNMVSLGITQEWLMAKVTSQQPRAWAQATKTTANQQQMFNRSFTNLGVIEKALPSLFRYTKFDDYPWSKVEVTFEDGSRLIGETNSYYVFMLPWKIHGQDEETYNAEISRAVSALLPSKALNKERLAGDSLTTELTEAVMRLIDTDWKLLGTEERAGDALRRLRTAYEVIKADINPYHNPEYGTATYKGELEEMNLHISLRKPTFPPNVFDAVVLHYADGVVEGVDEFMKSVGKYEQLVFSVPWLNSYVREHPRVAVRISYVKNLSFGEKAMRVFSADMKMREREDLIEQVKAQQSDVALLIIGNTYSESYWLVFPDHHMILWRYEGASGLLSWTHEDFGHGQCSEYEENFGGCSGRAVTPDGTLAPKDIPQDQICMARNRKIQHDSTLTGDDLFPVMDRGKGGFIDRTGKTVIPLCFETVGDFSEGLARFERDGYWGYIDIEGTVVIEPVFPWAKEFLEGHAKVQISGSSLGIDGKWGFIDKTGKIVIPPKYKSGYGEKRNIGSDSPEESFHDGLAEIEINGKSGFIDQNGKLVIPAEFTYACPFAEGLACATKSSSGEDGWGYIDTSGNWFITPRFKWVNSFSEGLAPVNLDQRCGYIDRSGKIVLQPHIFPGETDCSSVLGDFSEGFSRWKVGKKYGYIDRTGKIVIKPRFDLAFHFSEGLAAVKIGDKWGYVDRAGEMIVKPRKLFRAEDFHHGLAFVTTEDGKFGYIDKSGKYVWIPTRPNSD